MRRKRLTSIVWSICLVAYGPLASRVLSNFEHYAATHYNIWPLILIRSAANLLFGILLGSVILLERRIGGAVGRFDVWRFLIYALPILPFVVPIGRLYILYLGSYFPVTILGWALITSFGNGKPTAEPK